jgi:hypothetical protein
VNGTGEQREHERLVAAEQERARIRQAFPSEFADGARRAFTGDHLYPSGFLDWPLDRRNAWYAGFNHGYALRKRAERGE